jgi:uncharacterized protein (DUF4415 family)
MSKKSAESSPRGKQPKKSVKYTSNTQKNKTTSLKVMEDAQIDMSDIPEIDLNQLGSPVVGKFYRPIKKPVSIRLDADVLAWFKTYPHYQTLINKICRYYMIKHQKKSH